LWRWCVGFCEIQGNEIKIGLGVVCSVDLRILGHKHNSILRNIEITCTSKAEKVRVSSLLEFLISSHFSDFRMHHDS
jgi:hypothetical protein